MIGDPHPEAGERYNALTNEQLTALYKLRDEAAVMAQIAHDITVGDIDIESGLSMIGASAETTAEAMERIAQSLRGKK